jgi:CRISPR-associated protein Csm4
MQWITAHIRPRSAFGTPLRGDTLFGQLCWLLRYRHGEAALAAWLEGYAAGHPFACLSDALPQGWAPRPDLPPAAGLDPDKRKADKKKRLVSLAALAKPLGKLEDGDLQEHKGWFSSLQSHNSIGRESGTTGNGADPFQAERRWPSADTLLDVHIVFAPERIDADTLMRALGDVGQWGYGRDASIGLGRFELVGQTEGRPAAPCRPDGFLTLAPCAPQGGPWDSARCFYRPFVRFGRHGGEAAQGANPFKAPLLLADTGAVLVPQDGAMPDPWATMIVGRGLGGGGQLSRQIPQTVHQGYAPALPIELGEAV